MDGYRLGSGVIAHYGSFEEAAKAFKCKQVKRRTSDLKKLNAQRERFSKSHKCKACGQPMSFLQDSNVFVCKNKDCLGIKTEKKDEHGNVISTTYFPSYDVLDDKGAEIANNIFKD